MSIKYFSTLFLISFISFAMGLVWIATPKDSWVRFDTNRISVHQESQVIGVEKDSKAIKHLQIKDSLRQKKKPDGLQTHRANP